VRIGKKMEINKLARGTHLLEIAEFGIGQDMKTNPARGTHFLERIGTGQDIERK